jgi:hypothetical protein
VKPSDVDKTDPRIVVDVQPAKSAPSAHAPAPANAAVRARGATRPPPAAARFYPLNPRTLDDAGLSPSQLEAAVLKAIFFAGEMRGIELARHLKLPMQLIEPTLDLLRKQKFVDIKGGTGVGFGMSTMIFALTSMAEQPLKQVLDLNRYNGPAPVPYRDWVAAVRAQSIRGVRVTRQMLTQRLDGLIVRESIFDGLGPAMNSGRAIFFYGPPGNGKTAICQRMANCYSWDVFVPYAVEIDGFVVKIFDEIIHRPVAPREGDPATDERWVRCKRPLVVVGGELTLDMLEMAYSPEVKFYEAPLQMKASNGVLLIDDFGRQRVTPRELLNRWIFPLENDVDYLKLASGKMFSIPFDAFLVFSTNLDPKDLVDDAFLRRVRYKLKIEAPDEEMYKQIFRAQCALKGLEYDDLEVDQFILGMKAAGRPLAACQPRDLLEQVIDHAVFRAEKPALTAASLERAMGTYFAQFR